MKIVYIDELFVLNLLVNYLVLLATANFSGMPYNNWRLMLTAALGGAYAVAACLPTFAPLAWLPTKLAVGLLLVLVGFGRSNRADFVKRTLIFLLVSLLFAGAVLLVNIMFDTGFVVTRNGTLYSPVSARTLIIATAAACALVSLLFGGTAKPARGGTVRVTITHRNKKSEFTALVDSGNLLRDPMTGAPVVIAELAAISAIIDVGVRSFIESSTRASELLEHLAVVDPAARWRLIPYRAVGVEGGMLAAFKPDTVELAGKKLDGALVAISPSRLGASAGWCALVGAL